jgi:hypothetical protein
MIRGHGDTEMGKIRGFRELNVYRMAMDAAVHIQVKAAALEQEYEYVLGKLVSMISHPEQWAIRIVREEAAEYETETH